MNYPVVLGGVTFDVPSLPWRLVREIQPALIAWVDAHDFGARAEAFVRMPGDDLGALAGLVFRAVALSPQGRAMTVETFEDLPMTALEMAAAVNPILRACGLRFAPASEGADPKA